MPILQSKITRKELTERFLTYFETMTKGAVDVKKGHLALDADLHSDLMAALMETGSMQEDIWGINLYPSKHGDQFIEFTSLINIRPHRNNTSMEVEDAGIRDAIQKIVESFIEL